MSESGQPSKEDIARTIAEAERRAFTPFGVEDPQWKDRMGWAFQAGSTLLSMTPFGLGLPASHANLWFQSKHTEAQATGNALRRHYGVDEGTGTEADGGAEEETQDEGQQWEQDNVGTAPAGVATKEEEGSAPENPWLIPQSIMETARTVVDDNGAISEVYLPDGQGGEIRAQYRRSDAWNVLAKYRTDAAGLRRFRKAAVLTGYMDRPKSWVGPMTDRDIASMEKILQASNMSGLNWSDHLSNEATSAADEEAAEAAAEAEAEAAEELERAGIKRREDESAVAAQQRAEKEAEALDRLKRRADADEREAQRAGDEEALQEVRDRKLRIANAQVAAGRSDAAVRGMNRDQLLREADAALAEQTADAVDREAERQRQAEQTDDAIAEFQQSRELGAAGEEASEAVQEAAGLNQEVDSLLAEEQAWRERKREERVARLAQEHRARQELDPWLTEFENANGVVLTDEYRKAALFDLVKGRRSKEDVAAQVRKTQIAPQFPAFAEEIEAGMDLRDLAQPYVSAMARTLEIDPGTIGLNDPTIRKALRGKHGERVNVFDFEDEMRKDERWQYTDNAWEEVSKEASGIAEMFGVM